MTFPPRKHFTVPLPGRLPLELGRRTLVMGILNVTPDSFADGGLHFDLEDAVAHGVRMAAEGADIVDVGGESTRPGSVPLAEDEELRRVLPVIERLAGLIDVPIAVDTYKGNVAREAVGRGATIVNDISNLQYDTGLGHAVAATGAALVLMHNRGRSTDMYSEAAYSDVAGEVRRELHEGVARALECGVSRGAIIVDPGFGFAKRAEHTFEALARLDELASLDRPILSGPSRKSFLHAAIGARAPGERQWGTAAAVATSVLLGAHIVRVHDVPAMVDVVRVADQVRASLPAPPGG